MRRVFIKNLMNLNINNNQEKTARTEVEHKQIEDEFQKVENVEKNSIEKTLSVRQAALAGFLVGMILMGLIWVVVENKAKWKGDNFNNQILKHNKRPSVMMMDMNYREKQFLFTEGLQRDGRRVIFYLR